MSRLHFSDFLAEIRALPPGALTEDRLFDLASRLQLDSALLAPHIQFSEEGYARNVLYRDSTFEAICLCWLPGQGTPVHNHGRSFGVVLPWEGHLACTGFRRLDDGSVPGVAALEATSLTLAAPGSIVMDRVGSIHRLSNPPGSGSSAVSLHFYAGPLDWMEVFDVRAGTVEVRPMLGEPVGSAGFNDLSA